jgi:transposase
MITEHSVITKPVRRIEVFTGAGRRRIWSAEEKARIVAESMTSEASVCSVARRHGLSPQQLFGWRRHARESAGGDAGANTAGLFVPAIIESPKAAPAIEASAPRSMPVRERAKQGSARRSPAIELEVGSVTVRISHDAATETITAVIRALKAGA